MDILQSGHYSTLIYYAFAVMWRSPISILCEWDGWVSAAASDREIYSLWSILQEQPPLSTVIALWGLSKFKINYSADGPTCLCVCVCVCVSEKASVFQSDPLHVPYIYFSWCFCEYKTHQSLALWCAPSVSRPNLQSTRALSPHLVRVHWHNLHGKKNIEREPTGSPNLMKHECPANKQKLDSDVIR